MNCGECLTMSNVSLFTNLKQYTAVGLMGSAVDELSPLA